jgi:hypothetical protein
MSECGKEIVERTLMNNHSATLGAFPLLLSTSEGGEVGEGDGRDGFIDPA